MYMTKDVCLISYITSKLLIIEFDLSSSFRFSGGKKGHGLYMNWSLNNTGADPAVRGGGLGILGFRTSHHFFWVPLNFMRGKRHASAWKCVI